MTSPRATRRTLLAAGATGLALTPVDALADNPYEVRRYFFKQEGQEYNTGGAIIRVKAPMEDVVKEVLKYRRYNQVLPRMKTSKIVGRDGKKSTDVYMRAPIFGGTMSIWFVSRFVGPLPWKWGGVKIVGNLVRSNVKSFIGTWKLHPCGKDDAETTLRLELNLVPKVPVPTGLLERSFRWAAEKGVVAMRDLTEKGESTVIDD